MKFSVYMLTVVVARSFSDVSAICCVLPFLDDVMFLHNGASGAESKTSSSLGGGATLLSTTAVFVVCRVPHAKVSGATLSEAF